MIIIPTILEKEFDKAESKINRLNGLTKWVQIDVVDGIFTAGKSFELELVNTIEGEDWLWEIHLMVKEPKNWINKCVFISASRIIGQVEMMSNREDFVKTVKDNGIEAGVAMDIDTEIGKIPGETDLVLLMARKAGFERFEFEKKVIEKIKILRQAQDDKGLEFKIAVDGGINKENISKVEEAGADIVYSGEGFEELNAKNNENN